MKTPKIFNKEINYFLIYYKFIKIIYKAGINFFISSKYIEKFFSSVLILKEIQEKQILIKRNLQIKKIYTHIFINFLTLLNKSILLIKFIEFIILLQIFYNKIDNIKTTIKFNNIFNKLKYFKSYLNLNKVFSKKVEKSINTLVLKTKTQQFQNYLLDIKEQVKIMKRKSMIFETKIIDFLSYLNISIKIKEIFIYFFLTRNYYNSILKIIIYFSSSLITNFINKNKFELKKQIYITNKLIDIINILINKKKINYKNLLTFWNSFITVLVTYYNYENLLFKLIFKSNLNYKIIIQILDLPLY